MVPISTVVSLRKDMGATVINRFNQYRSVQINGNPAVGRSSGEAMKTMEQLAATELPKDYGFAWSGTSRQEIESSGSTGAVLGLCLLFVYLFLV